MDNKLLPCPFCGGHADIAKFPDNNELDNTRIYCTKCQCRTYRVCESMAIEQWNARVNTKLDKYKTALDIALADIENALSQFENDYPEIAWRAICNTKNKVTDILKD